MKTFKFSIILLALFFAKSSVQASTTNTHNISTIKDSLVAVKHLRISDLKTLERGVITIYERQRPGDKLNLFKPVLTHYFSLKGSDKVFPLTIENLKQLYSNGKAFEILDTRFRTDSELLDYDKVHQQFSVNYYLSKVDPV